MFRTVMSLWRLVLSEGGPPYQPSPYPSGRTLLSREETTPRSTPITDGSIPGEQQVQVKVLIRPGLEPETSQPQRSALPPDHAGLVNLEVEITGKTAEGNHKPAERTREYRDQQKT